MKQILILGAGRSSSVLINYLIFEGKEHGWHITVADNELSLAQQKTGGHINASALEFDVFNDQHTQIIKNFDLVISLLPANFHIRVLKCCIHYKKSMLSASYINNDIKALEPEIKEAGILVLKECGLDPGLDHMSAMQIIDQVQEAGGKLVSFKSFTGGLIAPESDDNPWHYKFSWNPRNVVLAGQGVARYVQDGKLKFIPYHKLFFRTEKMYVDGVGDLEGYPNRDSDSYKETYKLNDIPHLLRGTFRYSGFCSAWNVFVQLGMTDDSYIIENTDGMTYMEYLDCFLPFSNGFSVEERFSTYTGLVETSSEYQKIKWLGFFEDNKIDVKSGSPATILQSILEKKWALRDNDIDMIVMQHQFEYMEGEQKKSIISELVVKGEDLIHTAMAKTVGLPLGIVAKLILNGSLKLKGLHIPVIKEIYEPVLAELKELGVAFKHR